MEISSRSTTEDDAVLAGRLFSSISSERKGDIEKFLQRGADPNFILQHGHSPFHLAAGCEKSSEFVRLILRYNGDPNVRNSEGQTPLHIATTWGRMECMKLLVKNGADVLLKDHDGKDLMGFAKENGSDECMSLVERLLLQNNSKIIPKSSRHEFREKAPSGNKENQTPNSETIMSFDNIRSPLHNQCDDSWIVKERGTSSRRRRLDSGKNSAEHSPVSSPVRRQKNNANIKTAFCSPCCKKSCEKLPKEEKNIMFGYHVSLSPLKKGCCPCKADRQLCCGAVRVPYILTPVVTTEVHHCKTCSVNNNEEKGSGDLDTTDKCIGTSMLDSGDRSAHKSIGDTDSVGCQVAINMPPEEPCADALTASGHLLFPSTSLEKKSDSDGHAADVCAPTSDAVTESSSMEDFLKGCGHFLDKHDKGLDVSSPDHCTSFTLASKSNRSTPVSKNAEDKAEILHPNRQDNEKSSPATPVFHKQPKVVADDSPCRGTLSKKDVDLSPSRNMLLSTKVPLSRCEIARLYGEHVLPECVGSPCSKSSQDTIPSPKNKSPIMRDTGRNDSFTFSESTVAIEKSEDHTKSARASPSSPAHSNHSSISLRRFAASHVDLEQPLRKVQTPCSCKSPSSSGELGRSSISLRKFAAEQSCRNPQPQSSMNQLHGNSGMAIENVSVASTNARMHSTALTDTLDASRFGIGSLDISIIKASGEVIFESTHSEEVCDQQSLGLKESTFQVADDSIQPSTVSSKSCQSTIIYNWKSFWKGEPLSSSVGMRIKKGRKKAKKSETTEASGDDVPELSKVKDLENLTNNEIRDKLIALGYNPGPIHVCREMYIKKLEMLWKNGAQQTEGNEKGNKSDGNPASNSTTGDNDPKFSAELNRCVMGFDLPDSAAVDDEEVRQQFEQPDPDVQWREGTLKNSFTYLLLDPRVTDKLPVRAKNMPIGEVFKSFAGAIFYVGKGKQSRPYNHFHEAMQTNVLQYKLNPSRKIRHIHDIWGDGHGVISLHVFQSVIACEAYTREAAMIDSIGLGHLTNLKKGEYYGVAASWDISRKRRYGTYLVKKALDVLMVEGERQIRPTNLRSQNARQWTVPKSPRAAK